VSLAPSAAPSADDDPVDASSRDTLILGLVAAPDFSEEIAQRVSADLAQTLEQRIGGRIAWDVRTERDLRVGDAEGGVPIIDAAREVMQANAWDLAVCLTDLPLRIQGRLVVADASVTHRVALICLPALGPRHPSERAREAVIRVVEGLVDPRRDWGGDGGADVDDELRLTASRLVGRVRLLAGMVRANRPWRLAVNMTRALTAALSTVAIVSVNSQIWQLEARLSWPRLLAICLGSIVALIIALIVAHDLWRTPGTTAREQDVLFNAVTLITLTIGVLCLYAALFVANLLAALLVVDSHLLASQAGHPVGFSDYLRLSWMASSLATVGGALGSGLESDDSVRAAAYGYRPIDQGEREDAAQGDDR
jgi:uncharacterized membrane protein